MKKIVLIIISLMVLAGFAAALELPPEPMRFYGSVTYTNGNPIPNGYYIVAKIGSAVSEECEIINGKYGLGTDTCVVIKPSSSSSTVEFFLGDIKVGEYSFQNREFVNLNFTTNSLPVNQNPISNGVCEPEKGECSYNLADCDASKTTVCSGNGRCDVEIGETCTFNSLDCGVCPPENPGNSGGNTGSSGGSSKSSSGSSSSSSSKTTNLSSTNNLTFNTSDFNLSGFENKTNSTEDSNQKIKKKRFFPIITGAVTGFVKSGAGKGVIVFILIIAVLGLIIAGISKTKPKSKKEIKVVKLSDLKNRPKKTETKSSKKKK